MCGRFALRRVDKLKLDKVDMIDFESSVPRYNIAPTQPIWAVTETKGDRELKMLQWGLIPSWSDKPAGIINARGESVDDKASFKESFRRRRCLIPADGFYEWEKLGKAVQPHFFQFESGEPFCFAGLWDEWRRESVRITSCAIITTVANELLSTIHNRMPVILPKEAYDEWLQTDARVEDLQTLLVPFPASEMTGSPVSSRVNSADADDAKLVDPIEHGEDLVQRLLF